MDKALVSVIIPCYNYGHFISETIQSVIDQAYPHWECLVVNDGSTDDTTAIVKAFASRDKRIKLINKTNGGQSSARNKGLEYAKGTYVQFLDADDVIQPGKLLKQVSYLQQNTAVDLVYSGIRYFRSGAPEALLFSRDGKNTNSFPYVSGYGHELLGYFHIHNPMEMGAILFRKKVLLDAGCFDEEIKGVEDWDIGFKIAVKNYYFQFQDFENAYIVMRYHPQSFSTSTSDIKTAFYTMKKNNLSFVFRHPLFAAVKNEEKVLRYFGKTMLSLIAEKRFARALYQVFKLTYRTRKFKYYCKLYFQTIFTSTERKGNYQFRPL